MTKRRVAVTGLGLLTACGKGWQVYWEAALRGGSRIRPVRNFSLNGFRQRFAGELPDFSPQEFVAQRKSLKLMSRDIQMGVAASRLAIEDGRLDMNAVDHDAFGICLGSGIINNELDELGAGVRAGMGPDGKFSMPKFGAEGIKALFPLWFLKYLPNMPACHIAIQHGLRGPSNTLTTSSAASLQAIGEAARTIERGDALLMLAGGADSEINAVGFSRLHMLGLLASAERAGRYAPFDETSDGIIPAEGAGMVLLEDYEQALRRGARIYAEIAGYGSSAGGDGSPKAKERAMRAAIADAGIEPAEIGAVIADGSGLPEKDVEEALAIAAVFGRQAKPVTCLKPLTGHALYASGSIEFAAAVQALREKRIPPLANLEKPRRSCELAFVRDPQPMAEDARFVLLNSFGLGGQNASLVIKRHDDREGGKS